MIHIIIWVGRESLYLDTTSAGRSVGVDKREASSVGRHRLITQLIIERFLYLFLGVLDRHALSIGVALLSARRSSAGLTLPGRGSVALGVDIGKFCSRSMLINYNSISGC